MAERSISELIKGISDDSKAIAEEEIALAKAEATAGAKNLGIGAGLAIVALFLLFLSSFMVIFAGAAAFREGLGWPWWASFLIIFGILAVIAVILVLTGNGDVLEPADGIAAIGSGGNFALAAARFPAAPGRDGEQGQPRGDLVPRSPPLRSRCPCAACARLARRSPGRGMPIIQTRPCSTADCIAGRSVRAATYWW